MITKRERKLSNLLILIQVIISLFIFHLVELFVPNPKIELHEKIFYLTQIAIIWLFLFYKFRLGVIFRASTFLSMIRGYLVTISIASILLFLELRILILFGHYSYSAYYILWFCLLNFVALTLFKLVFYHTMKHLRKTGHNSRNVIIIADSSSTTFVNEFIKTKDWGYNLKAILTPDKTFPKLHTKTIYFDNQNQIYKRILLKGIDDIFYCMPVNNTSCNAQELIEETEQVGITVHIMQEEFYNTDSSNELNNNTFSNQFITHQTTSTKYIELKAKEIFDIFFSAIVLVISIPLMIIITILIYAEDKGPILFKQERIGLNGRRFTCFKFRSMVVNAELLLNKLKDQNESDGPTFKIEKDPRVTRIGRILRKTSLDEFPQFYNVIRGEMSVVGPRPPLLKEVMLYEKYQLRRLSMKPGITCIWQVSGRNSIPFEQWMQMDLDYIDKWSIKMDAKIILKTIAVVFKANGH